MELVAIAVFTSPLWIGCVYAVWEGIYGYPRD